MAELKYVENVLTRAYLTDEVSEIERKNRAFTRRMASEGIVLLENDGTLPLSTDQPVALYGVGATNTIVGGSGSGETNVRYSVSIYDGMKEAGFLLVTEELLLQYAEKERNAYAAFVDGKKKEAGFFNLKAVSMDTMKDPYIKPPFGLLEGSAAEADVCVYVVSRTSGEQYDRTETEGDYLLSEEEQKNLHWCAEHYNKVVLILNAGGAMDLRSVDDISFGAVVFAGMPGEEAGNAVADVLSGKVAPSGHLAASWPFSYEDVPCGETFGVRDGNVREDFYREDVFVGYRYYERFGVPIRYAFGHGLSYTDFSMKLRKASASEAGVLVEAEVENVGPVSGKAVAQFYVSQPEGKLYQPMAVLADYVKTAELAAGEKETVSVQIPWESFAGFDEETGDSIMEAGHYAVLLGSSSAEKTPIVSFELHETVVLQHFDHICKDSKRWEKLVPPAPKQDWDVPAESAISVSPEMICPTPLPERTHPMDRYEARARQLAETLTDKELAMLLVGIGSMDMLRPGRHDIDVPGITGTSTQKLIDKGIHTLNFCDGPAGLRFNRKAVVKKGADRTKTIDYSLEILRYLPGALRMLGEGKPEDGTVLYQYATGFPTGTVVAQTWSRELATEMGSAAADEMNDFGVNVWLAPGVNIQRNPLCGRNYEYFSEDPLLTGKTAAAMVTGIQSHPGCFGTMKHFLGNNQEEDRQQMNAHISERALREVYLKGFGIAVKEADARAIMSSYNRVNDVWSGVNKDTLTNVLRKEWGFRGIACTDWDDSHEGLEAERSIDAGINFLMPGSGSQRKAIEKALKAGTLSREVARERVVKNLQAILLCEAELSEERNRL